MPFPEAPWQSQHCAADCFVYETAGRLSDHEDSPGPGVQTPLRTPGQAKPPCLVTPTPVAQQGNNTAPAGQQHSKNERARWVQQLRITAALSSPAVPVASHPGPVRALTSTGPLAATPVASAVPNPAAFTSVYPAALREAVALSKAWQKQRLQEAMAQSNAWQKEARQQTLQQQLSLPQPSVLMPAQDIISLAAPVPALLTLQCMAALAQPVLVSLHTMAAPPVPARPHAEALLKARACSMAWQATLGCAPQCSLPQPPLLMPAPALRPKSNMMEMLENSRLWLQKQRQQPPAPSLPQLPAVMLQAMAAPAPSQAVRDAMSCSKRWLQQQQHALAQIHYKVQQPCRQLTFSAFGPETDLQLPTPLRLGSLLDESQVTVDMLPQTGPTNVSQVATLCAVSPDGTNSCRTTAVAAVGDGGCHATAPSAATPDVQAAGPRDEKMEEESSKLANDQQAQDSHMDMRVQTEVVKEGGENKEKECRANRQVWNAKSKRWGSRARVSNGKHQGLPGNVAGSWSVQRKGGGPLTALAATQGEPRRVDPSMVPRCATILDLARKRDRWAKDPASRGIDAKATRKRKHAAAVGQVKSITRILPDEMETQPADINEMWFATLMEPTLRYDSVEHSSNPLDTAITLEFPGIAVPRRLQTAPTLFYADVATPTQPLKALAAPTLVPEPSAAALSSDATAPNLQIVAMLSSIPAAFGTATSLFSAAHAVKPRAVAAAAPPPLAYPAPTTSDAAEAPDARN